MTDILYKTGDDIPITMDVLGIKQEIGRGVLTEDGYVQVKLNNGLGGQMAYHILGQPLPIALSINFDIAPAD